MRILVALGVFIGIPAVLVSLHAGNRSVTPDQAPSFVSVPSYNVENVEKCFFWVPEEGVHEETIKQ